MKGGKKGRDPKTGSGRKSATRGKPKADPKKRPAGPPPKGSRKRPFGGSSSTGEE